MLNSSSSSLLTAEAGCLKYMSDSLNLSDVISRAGKTPSTPKECFQLLSRTTQVFREEYIQKQDLAREEIEKRFVDSSLLVIVRFHKICLGHSAWV